MHEDLAPLDHVPAAPRGDRWVLLQFIAFAAVLVTAAIGPQPRRGRRIRRVLALAVATAGVATVLRARRDLGDAFSVFPRPVAGAPRVNGGLYGRIRHPMYAGVMAQALAASVAGSPCALVPSAALGLILDHKARIEEQSLDAAHPGTPVGPHWRFVPGVR